ncbi:MAG: metallophosphoesterase [Cyanobacteriota bacterium]|nr:metallophosphoesterase [Cyanobacteriota bacterium]
MAFDPNLAPARAALPPITASLPPHWVIGDLHGCAASLVALLGRLPRTDRLIFCGDVINRGPTIEAAMEMVWQLVEQGRAVWLMGNHERDLVRLLEQDDWLSRRRLAGLDTYRQLGDQRARFWARRLRRLPLVYWADGWVATHAGFDPHSWEPSLEVRMPFWHSYDGRYGEVIVGHTPGPEVRRINRIRLIDTGACYGGPLTAYCPETGAVVQVRGPLPAAAADPPARCDLVPL